MTIKELRDYVDEQRTLDNIPYHVYSELIDGIDALEQEPCEDISPTAVPITVEEAKRLLYTEWKNEVTKDKSNDRLLVAYQMAIKALEQEPCEDAISRRAVLEQIDQWAIGSREYLYTNAIYYLTRRIQDIPPVNPTKTGH